MDVKKLIAKHEVEHVYQPMWNLHNWSVFGYEALLRVTSQIVENIEDVFVMARDQGMLYKLDTLAIHGAIRNFRIHLLEEEILF